VPSACKGVADLPQTGVDPARLPIAIDCTRARQEQDRRMRPGPRRKRHDAIDEIPTDINGHRFMPKGLGVLLDPSRSAWEALIAPVERLELSCLDARYTPTRGVLPKKSYLLNHAVAAEQNALVERRQERLATLLLR
jgi:hypothetical protein